MKKGFENKTPRSLFSDSMGKKKKKTFLAVGLGIFSVMVVILALVLFLLKCDRQGVVVDNNVSFNQNQSHESFQNIENKNDEADASVEKLDDETVGFGEYTAFTAERSGKNYMILKKGDQETIVDQGDESYDDEMFNLGEVKSFSSLRFSKNGQYLFYSAEGYEWGKSYLYDILNGKIVISVDSPSNFDFTPDEKYLFFCVSRDVIGDVEIIPGKVYSVPDFEKIFDAPVKNVLEYFKYDCRYDEKRNAIIFSMSSNSEENKQPNKEVVYPLGN